MGCLLLAAVAVLFSLTWVVQLLFCCLLIECVVLDRFGVEFIVFLCCCLCRLGGFVFGVCTGLVTLVV